jgi:hypothetical protein
MNTSIFYHCAIDAHPADLNTSRIAALNDQLRRDGIGGAVVLTNGIQSLEPHKRRAVIKAVSTFDAFTEANDPWHEHDCATLTVAGVRAMFKIDYYDRTMTRGSEDPGDPKVTRRVMTILLAEEY